MASKHLIRRAPGESIAASPAITAQAITEPRYSYMGCRVQMQLRNKKKKCPTAQQAQGYSSFTPPLPPVSEQLEKLPLAVE